MFLPKISIQRPIFVSSILVLMIIVGILSATKLPVELFPDISFPIVTVTTVYPGASPNEIESLVSKPIEEEMGSIAGTKVIRSINRESVSVVVAEYNLDVDIKFAEQQVRDRVASAKKKLPEQIDEPVIRRVDPAAQPIIILAIKSPLKGGALYDLANEVIKPELEQVDQVGRVDVVGGSKREIQIQLDRTKLNSRELSVMQVANSMRAAGQNIPTGKVDQDKTEKVFRVLGEYSSVEDIRNSVVSFFGNDSLTKIGDIGKVVDTVEDEKMRAYLNGENAALLYIFKQSGANTIKVSSGVIKRLTKVNENIKAQYGKENSVEMIRDMSHFVWENVFDVGESILFGIILTILVVFVFLGSARSTFITGLAIPVSLIGCMGLIYVSGLTINVMTLLAFSLAVGLLIDDAIVVRENIFRHMEMGKSAMVAAYDGTVEVGIAVIAVTLAILAVFGPIAFLSGVVGQFFKSFGLGVCYVMIISLFDALTNAPMLSAYFGGVHSKHTEAEGFSGMISSFSDRMQTKLENSYESLLKLILRSPFVTLMVTTLVVFGLGYSVKFIPKTFLPPQDSGEFNVSLELPPGATLDTTQKVAKEAEKYMRSVHDVEFVLLTVGNENGQSYKADYYVKLTPFKTRNRKTSEVKVEVREGLRKFEAYAPKVKDVDFANTGQRPFVVNVKGQNLDEVRKVAQDLFAKLKTHPGLIDPEVSDKPGLPEFQVKVDNNLAHRFGANAVMVGQELRDQVEGVTPAKYRENGLEYDVRVRLQQDQRDLEKYYNQTKVPNLNGRLVSLNSLSSTLKQIGPATINRENRGRYISIEADLKPGGPGMGGVIQDIDSWAKSGNWKLPAGVTYRYVGQAENFQELAVSIMTAGFLALICIYLVLASLYESLVTPFTIMLVIPLAVFGGFFGLFVTHSSLDLFSMIGCIMLMGLATKNSIIMVDYINQKILAGMKIEEAIMAAGKARLRPILMTSLALIAGMMPVAIGLNEASSQRSSLGIAVVGGVAISTLLTLLVIPAVFQYLERFRRWMDRNVLQRIVTRN